MIPGGLSLMPTMMAAKARTALSANSLNVRIRLADVEKAWSTRVLPVEVMNCSACTWQATADSGVFLANSWLDQKGRVVKHIDGRSSFTQSVAPGTTVTVEIAVQAPAEPGLRILEIDLVDEGVTWFSEQGSSAHHARVEVQRMEVTPFSTMEQA